MLRQAQVFGAVASSAILSRPSRTSLKRGFLLYTDSVGVSSASLQDGGDSSPGGRELVVPPVRLVVLVEE